MSRNDDWTKDPNVQRWIRHVIDEMVPKLTDSAFVMQLVPHGDQREGDVKFWVELGASVMMNKPIIAVAFSRDEIPPKLKLIADEIVVCPDGVNEESSRRIARAIARITKRLETESA